VSKKAWIIFAAICVVLLGGLIFISSKDKIDVSGVDANKIQKANTQSGDIADHVYGKADSKVVLIEYGDYQCPGCGSAYPNVKAVTEKYKGQVAFIFRNFPITSLHPNARVAAAVAEAAGLQGKFWEMHNELYETQSSWETLNSSERTDYFVGVAKKLGLNTETFKTDFASTKVNQKISYDQAIGKKINVNATPTFYLNGKGLDQSSWSDQDKLDATIVAEMKNNGISVPETPAAQ
jgi:protein-disulfide isomerase